MKSTAIICDRCGVVCVGQNWARQWYKAKKRGWVEGKKYGTHYCPECVKKLELVK